MEPLANICTELHKTYNTVLLNEETMISLSDKQFFEKAAETLEKSNKDKVNTTLIRLIRNLTKFPDSPRVSILSGPMSISKHKKGDKTFYIIGENHKGQLCQGTIVNSNMQTFTPVAYYLKELALKTPAFLDIYIEMSREFEEQEKQISNTDTSSIDYLINNFKECYRTLSKDDICKNSRIHWTDIRTIDHTSMGFMSEVLKVIKYIQTNNDMGLSDNDKTENIKYLLRQIKVFTIPFLKVYSKPEMVVEERVTAAYKLMFANSPLLRKEIDRSTKKAELKLYAKQRIREYVTSSPYLGNLHPDKFRELLISMSSNEKIVIPIFVEFFLSDLGVIVMDLYLLARVFKRFNVPSGSYQPIEPHNIIIYAGNYHCERYRSFLQQNEYATEFMKYNDRLKTIEGESIANSCLDISDLPQPLFRN